MESGMFKGTKFSLVNLFNKIKYFFLTMYNVQSCKQNGGNRTKPKNKT